MKNTGIQWADDTVNPTSGCDGCELWVPGRGGPCYAGNFHELRLAKSLPNLYDPIFTNVREIPGRISKAVRCQDLTGRNRPDKPWLNGLRRKLFIGDLGDIFSARISFDFLKSDIIDIAKSKEGSRHDFQLLTKQPKRAVEFAQWLDEPWPENVWIGTSITSAMTHSRIKALSQVPAKIRFLSLEPLVNAPKLTTELLKGISWIIIGGESGQGEYVGRNFHLSWIRELIPICREMYIALFVKQMGANAYDNGRKLELIDSHGGDWLEWPEDIRIREMPKI
jgi:protein gp37